MKPTLVFIILSAGIISTQAQTTTYDWSFIAGGTSYGSGTITIQDTISESPYVSGYYGYLATAMTGSANGELITGLNNIGAVGGFDQLIISTDSYPYIDANGIDFNTFMSFGGAIYHNGSTDELDAAPAVGIPPGQFTLSPVPEHSTAVLAGAAAGILLLLRRKR